MNQNQEIRLVLKTIRKIARALDIHSRHMNRESGLTLPQLIVMRCVRDLGNPTGSEISKEVDLSPPTVLGILDKLAAKGLIERQRPQTNRRIVTTTLSEKGDRVIKSAPSPLGDAFSRRFFALDPAERRHILASLELVADFTRGEDLEEIAQTLEPDNEVDLISKGD